VAGEVEMAFCKAGVPVFSNARNYRMVADVPLVVPPVNGDHLDMVRSQASFPSGGFIVTNANCSTTGLVVALKPLADAFGIKAVYATTLQAISGAGYPGLPSLDILDNVVPYISGEEDKLETEYKKIMGAYSTAAPAAGVVPATFPLSAMVNRVHVRDGHSIAVSILLASPATPAQVAAVLANFKPAGHPDILSLPSAPAAFITVREEANRPQPRLDREVGAGYTTVVGRIRPDPINTVKLFVLSHNTVMGAAGSSILNAELAAVKGLLKHRS
jgi:aspartate-semialdehyde dehydrogenase